MNISDKKLFKYVGNVLFLIIEKVKWMFVLVKNVTLWCNSGLWSWINFWPAPTFTFHKLSVWWRKVPTKAVINGFLEYIWLYAVKLTSVFPKVPTPWQGLLQNDSLKIYPVKIWLIIISNEIKKCWLHYWKNHEHIWT